MGVATTALAIAKAGDTQAHTAQHSAVSCELSRIQQCQLGQTLRTEKQQQRERARREGEQVAGGCHVEGFSWLLLESCGSERRLKSEAVAEVANGAMFFIPPHGVKRSYKPQVREQSVRF